MKKYFINFELKLSSFILLCIMTIFLLVTYFFMTIYHRNLKSNYINTFGAIMVTVGEKEPELQEKLIPFITKNISAQDVSKGKSLLNKYGLTEDLEDELFPNIYSTIQKDYYFIIYMFIFITILLFILNFIQYRFFYTKIKNLTFAAEQVIEGNYNINLNENKEGDFSKLAVSFNFMKELIKNNLNELKKEKQFLINLLADISHQLKTPISSIILYNDIMIEKELSREQQEIFLKKNKSQLDRMTWLIKSLLKLAKIDAKSIQFSKENQTLNETINDSIDALENKAHAKNIQISFEEKDEVLFEHDVLWLQEAFINIIKNAIEHTPNNGQINIILSDSPICRRIIIKDTGEGISEDDLPNIFKRFYKAKNSNNSNSVGIGLSLTKSIIESHNGFIEAQSSIGIGTTFTITFLKY